MADQTIKSLQLPNSADKYIFDASYLGGTAASAYALKSEIPEGAKIKTLDTNNTTAQSTSSSESIGGDGQIKLHKISKTGNYNDLLSKPNLDNYVNTDTFNTLSTKVTSIEDSLGTYVSLSGNQSISGVKTFNTGINLAGSLQLQWTTLGDGGLLKVNDTGAVSVDKTKYTTNTGTVTSVAVRVNGTTKGTITTSGTIDLGSNFVTTDGTQTITGIKTFNAPTNISGTEQATTIFKTANGGKIIFGKEGPNSGTLIALDQSDGTRRLNFRASATPGAMVWSQPETGSSLYYDVTNVYFRNVNGVYFSNFKGGLLKTDANGKLSVDTSSYSTTDTNYYHTTGTWNGLTYTAKANGGAGALAFTIPTGTSASTVAVGNHIHSQYLTAHRTIQINGTSIGNNTLNLKAGNNITLNNSNGTVTINAASGGTSVVITDLTTI